MKKIVFNSDNLNEKDIDERVIRTKAIIINSKNEIMIGYGDKTYQFPGGHLKDNETLRECLKRELLEETGINFNTEKLSPFLKITHYSKNYRNTDKNRENTIYYFYIKSDKSFSVENTNLDENEKKVNYKIKMININDLENILIDSINDNPINEVIVGEMLIALDELENYK